jgi:hypothetical protein
MSNARARATLKRLRVFTPNAGRCWRRVCQGRAIASAFRGRTRKCGSRKRANWRLAEQEQPRSRFCTGWSAGVLMRKLPVLTLIYNAAHAAACGDSAHDNGTPPAAQPTANNIAGSAGIDLTGTRPASLGRGGGRRARCKARRGVAPRLALTWTCPRRCHR